MALHDTCSDRIFDVFVQSGPAAALGALPGSGGSRETWIRGAALGALGRYGRARSALEGLAADRGVHGSLAASTLASHLRQLGRHGDAREFDERALATAERLGDAGGAPGVDTPADALFDARLGLAADAVGLADVPAARSWLAAAGDDRALWRRDVRLGWVGTEIALLGGDPLTAVDRASAALAVAGAVSAPRHEAKCELFLGAALDAAGAPDADAALARAARGAAAIGAVPLVWVAELLLATRAGRRGDTRCWRAHLDASRAAVTAIGDGLPEYDRRVWMNRPDIDQIVRPVVDGVW